MSLTSMYDTNANLLIAASHGMIGLTAATATAELVTDLIADKQPAIDF